MRDEPTTLAARIREGFASHQLGALVVLAVAVLAGIGGAIGAFKEIANIFDADDAPPVRFGAGELLTVTIPRYGFSFSYPGAWEREDPENSDGAVITADSDEVELRAYGALAFSSGPPPSRERLEYLVEQERSNGARIVKEPVLQNVPGTGERAGADVQGLRFVAQAAATKDRPAVTRVVLLTSVGERDVHIVCEVPTERFARWQRACSQLVNSLTLTK